MHGSDHTRLELGLLFNLNYMHVPVRFCDCVLHSYDAVALMKCVHRRQTDIRTCEKLLKISSMLVPTAKGEGKLTCAEKRKLMNKID